VEYKGAHEPVRIIFNGVLYEQTPACHMRHRPEKKMTRMAFIKKAMEKWGDCYDYSQVRFRNMDTKVIIIDKETGESHEQTPTCHLRGRPRKRKPEKKKRKKRMTFGTGDFIRLSRLKWGLDTYDYSKTVYVDKRTPMIIGRNGHFSDHYLKSHFSEIKVHIPGDVDERTDRMLLMNRLYDDKYEFLGYDRKRGHYLLECPYHGQIQVTKRRFVKGKGCERCTKDHDRQRVVRLMKRHSIQFIRDHMVNDGERWFRFDFYLPGSGTFIDMYGIEHYQPVEYHGGLSMYELIKEDDMMKRLFCEENYYDHVVLRYDRKFSLDELVDLKR
jgi:hypothetical protein